MTLLLLCALLNTNAATSTASTVQIVNQTGQTLSIGIGRSKQAVNMDDLIQDWYELHADQSYTYRSDAFSSDGTTGHFTKMVWAKSRYIGCAISRDTSGFVLAGCDYVSAGAAAEVTIDEQHERTTITVKSKGSR